jgi:hypothetical protein
VDALGADEREAGLATRSSLERSTSASAMPAEIVNGCGAAWVAARSRWANSTAPNARLSGSITANSSPPTR